MTASVPRGGEVVTVEVVIEVLAVPKAHEADVTLCGYCACFVAFPAPYLVSIDDVCKIREQL
jgi:hypothetical protein